VVNILFYFDLLKDEKGNLSPLINIVRVPSCTCTACYSTLNFNNVDVQQILLFQFRLGYNKTLLYDLP
jgi:hypothetical protein